MAKARDRKILYKKIGMKVVWTLFRLIFIGGICFVILYPLFTKIMSGLMDVSDVYDSTIRYLPKNYTLDNVKTAMNLLEYPTALYNTIGVVMLISLVHVLACTLVAYGFARYSFPGRNLLFMLVLFALVIPPDVLMVPYYLMFRNFGLGGLIPLLFGKNLMLTDTVWPQLLLGMTCTGLKNGIYVFIMRQHFMGVPKELEEAAYVDGAGALKTLFRVILPGAVGMMVTVFLFSFVWQWLDATYTPVLCANMSIVPTTVGNLSNPLVGMQATADSSMMLSASLVKNAGIILVIAPLLFLYLVAQKFFVQSVERSGLVG